MFSAAGDLLLLGDLGRHLGTPCFARVARSFTLVEVEVPHPAMVEKSSSSTREVPFGKPCPAAILGLQTNRRPAS